MCGIAGLIDPAKSSETNLEVVRRMLARTHHRGPDASNALAYGPVVIGQNRLKIIDLSDASNQPFEYGSLSLVFNGEIYNYIELRNELAAQGHVFHTTGDTEVICAAYLEWGTSCVSRFIGMWAFALWDKNKKQLFCSRDRFGIKPFLYFNIGNRMWFASEMKALRGIEEFPKELNLMMADRGLSFGWCEFQDETFYKNVKTLPPAHHLIYADGKLNLTRYWDVSSNKKSLNHLSWGERCEQFRELFFESIRLHSRSDVANGICLSGGLDSSAIASAFGTIFPETKVKAFNIYFEGKGKVDERPFVKEVVQKYPTIDPYYYQPTHQDVADNWHRFAYQSDVPLWGSSYLSGYFVMELAKKNGVTVVNDGQGADEYLGGYLHSFYRIIGTHFRHLQFGKGWQLLQQAAQRENWSSSKKRDTLLKSAISALSNEDRIYKLEYSKYKSVIPRSVALGLEDHFNDKFDNFLYHLIFHATLQPILYFEDRRSMLFSLESRVPFLNHKLIEFAFSLSTEDRISAKGETKHILRESLRGILPDAIANRKDKKGFVTPGEMEWLGGPLRFLLEQDFNKLDFLNVARVKQLVASYKKGDTSQAALVWRLAALLYWLENCN
ncbi:MAG: asparagine synthase (glutamine-hydrolyzing) [Chitinophagales bacterium]